MRLYNNKLLIFFICFALAYSVMPALSYYLSPIIRITTLLVAYLLLIREEGTSTFFNQLKLLAPIYIITILDYIFIFSSNPGSLIYHFYDDFGKIFLSVVSLYILSNQHSKANSFVAAIVVIYGITVITTILGNITYPMASRSLATGMTDDKALYEIYRSLNIGGFDFVYSLVLPCYIIPYIYKSRVINRLISVLFIGLILYCLYETQYTIAVLTGILAVILFFTKKQLFPSDTRKYIVLFLLLAVIMWGLMPLILSTLASAFNDEILSERLIDIANVLSGNDALGDDAEQRKFRYQASIDAFLSSPIWGSLHGGGGHSFVLDTLAKYGLVGLACMITMLKNIFKLFVKPFEEYEFYGYVFMSFLIYVVLLIFNPSTLFVSLTFVLPVISYSLMKRLY